MNVHNLIAALNHFPEDAEIYFSYQEFMSIYGEGDDNRLGEIFEDGTFNDLRDGVNDNS